MEVPSGRKCVALTLLVSKAKTAKQDAFLY
jgi:hypothetical protein